MISVFGSTGFIGSNFCKLYKNEIIPVPRDSRTPLSDNILYLISTTHNYHIHDDIHKDVHVNIKVLLDVLDQCRSRNITFNFVSSWFVYGDTDLPAQETSYCNPKGFYSITKRAAEQLLVSFCETFNIKYRIFRLCNVYGPLDKCSSQKNALQFIIKQVCNNEPVSLYYDGEFIRDYMHVNDICRAIYKCIHVAPMNDIINIGSGNPYVFKTLIDYAIGKAHSSSQISSTPPPKFHSIVQVKDMYLDNTKLRKLGFDQSIDIYNGIDLLLDN